VRAPSTYALATRRASGRLPQRVRGSLDTDDMVQDTILRARNLIGEGPLAPEHTNDAQCD
jgi:hypothetical protein